MLAAALLLGGCTALRPEIPRLPSHATTQSASSPIGRAFAEQARLHAGQSGFQIMATGQEAFAARAGLARAAEHSLDLQYYSVGEDVTTDRLLYHLFAAAERGVRVRILLDDLAAPARHFARRAMAAHAGIEVRLFNPFHFNASVPLGRLGEFALDGDRLNRRMHNKLWVSDGAAAIIGSRNLGDEYFDANDFGNFHDVDLLVVGPIVSHLSRSFDSYWNSPAAVPAPALIDLPDGRGAAALQRNLKQDMSACRMAVDCRWLGDEAWLVALRSGSLPLVWADARFISDPPDQDKAEAVSGIQHDWVTDHPGGSRTEREMLIASPYFVPSAAGLRHLGEMRQRGVRIGVLTNSLASTDSTAAHAGYARHRAELLREGVELYEVRLEQGAPHDRPHIWGQTSPYSMHAKFLVLDRERLVVGSFNQDPRSRLHNTESWIAVDSPELATQLAALFDERTMADHAFRLELVAGDGGDRLNWLAEDGGLVIRFDDEPQASVWSRLWRKLLGVLIPEHLL